MKSLIKYVALGLFATAAIGMVACNNNTRSLKTAAANGGDGGGAVKDPGPGAGDGTGLTNTVNEGAGPDSLIGEYTFAMIDQSNSGNTFPIQGQLLKNAEDGQTFQLVRQEAGGNVYVVRVNPFAETGGGHRDYAFHFSWESNAIGDAPEIYIEHQELKGFFYRTFINVTDLNTMVSGFNVSQEVLLKKLADFLDRQQVEIVSPGIQYPEGHTLPMDAVALWKAEVQAELTLSH